MKDVDGELIVATRSLLWVLARRRVHASLLHNITVPVLLLLLVLFLRPQGLFGHAERVKV